ncbi:hypothetical protein GCM10009715_19060 [Paeniglutamicibacter psychrophenolicus]|uniref:2-keto-4-pentenoate hydratase/2-oxohepta-3-ene-1,7-dioic acid hydratase in catechol pathway n=1 Tax=Paeniglutamicibacter psychrophenolicus TaxID=257454 RepID=A0ABS4WJN5_9MICC|nr:fumarylacetoacetate hydrolase family protein [Paeniglutamicibacter psychrophenolicus]MBP2376416.1 2-keto-4-pentenoate hydratase/2-oxohepta-3-ene-1,7-dioic acid hydratase in catechol pathway [Paeniglutamicibacter psychrophenolicus]
MTLQTADWALATIESEGQTLACIETADGFFLLEPSLARVGLADQTTVISLFEDWAASATALKAAVAQLEPADRIEPDRRLAPLQHPGKIVCAGANYFDHLEEMGISGATKENQRLFFFMKPPRNSIVGEGDTVRMPIETKEFDWEVELAAVIGHTARNVSPEEALQHVAGYTVAIDFSARDHNRAPDTFYKLDWTAGKGHDTCCPIGPRIVPSSQMPDPQDVGLRLSVNGELKQDGRSSSMVFTLAEQISALSRIMTLDPGDLILTGTPAGVGAPRQTWLSVGDRVAVEIDHIGGFEVAIQSPA